MQVVAWQHMAPKPCGFSAGLPPCLQTEHNCFPSACCLRISLSGAQLACQSSGQPKSKSLNGAPLACQSSGQPSYSCQRTGSRLLMGLLLERFLRWSVQQQCTMSNAGMTCPHAVLSHKGVAMNPESKLRITDRFITILIGSPSSCGLQAQGAGLVPVWEGRPCAYALRRVTPQGEPHTQPIAAIVARLREPATHKRQGCRMGPETLASHARSPDQQQVYNVNARQSASTARNHQVPSGSYLCLRYCAFHQNHTGSRISFPSLGSCNCSSTNYAGVRTVMDEDAYVVDFRSNTSRAGICLLRTRHACPLPGASVNTHLMAQALRACLQVSTQCTCAGLKHKFRCIAHWWTHMQAPKSTMSNQKRGSVPGQGSKLHQHTW